MWLFSIMSIQHLCVRFPRGKVVDGRSSRRCQWLHSLVCQASVCVCVNCAGGVVPSGRGNSVMAVLSRPLPRLTRCGRSAWNLRPFPVSIRSRGVLWRQNECVCVIFTFVTYIIRSRSRIIYQSTGEINLFETFLSHQKNNTFFLR